MGGVSLHPPFFQKEGKKKLGVIKVSDTHITVSDTQKLCDTVLSFNIGVRHLRIMRHYF